MHACTHVHMNKAHAHICTCTHCQRMTESGFTPSCPPCLFLTSAHLSCKGQSHDYLNESTGFLVSHTGVSVASKHGPLDHISLQMVTREAVLSLRPDTTYMTGTDLLHTLPKQPPPILARAPGSWSHSFPMLQMAVPRSRKKDLERPLLMPGC